MELMEGTTTYSELLRLTMGCSTQGTHSGLLVPPCPKQYGNEKKPSKMKQNGSQSQNASYLVGLRWTQGLTAFCEVYEQITVYSLII